MSIGINIKYYREKSLMSQTELAIKLSISTILIKKWELEIEKPSEENQRLIADALNIKQEALISSIEFYFDSPNQITKRNKIKKQNRFWIIFGKFWGYLFAWIHLDITIGFTSSVIGIVFTFVGLFGSIGMGIESIIYFHDSYNTLRIIYTVLLFLTLPALLLIMVPLGYFFIWLSIVTWNFSLKFFWKKNIMFTLPTLKINKILLITTIIYTILILLVVGGFFVYLYISDNLDQFIFR